MLSAAFNLSTVKLVILTMCSTLPKANGRIFIIAPKALP